MRLRESTGYKGRMGGQGGVGKGVECWRWWTGGVGRGVDGWKG